MPEFTAIIAILLLVSIVEASPAIRLPIGLLLAIAMLALDADLLPIALLGALGVLFARLALALLVRAGRDRLESGSPQVQAQRAALRAQLSASPAYVRLTFLLAALPGMPAGIVFPMLGAMRMPLWPALAGTLAGRIPVLALTTAMFAWLGRLVTEEDAEAAVLLATMAIFLLVLRTIGRIDWAWRSETGGWRLREDDRAVRMAAMFGGSGRRDAWNATTKIPTDDGDVVEGELLGEEVVEPEHPHLPAGDDDNDSAR
jgi:hypothetical protein